MGWVVSNNKYDLPGGDLGYKYVPVDHYCAEDLTTFQTYDPADPDSTETTDSTTSITCTTGNSWQFKGTIFVML